MLNEFVNHRDIKHQIQLINNCHLRIQLYTTTHSQLFVRNRAINTCNGSADVLHSLCNHTFSTVCSQQSYQYLKWLSRCLTQLMQPHILNCLFATELSTLAMAQQMSYTAYLSTFCTFKNKFLPIHSSSDYETTVL